MFVLQALFKALGLNENDYKFGLTRVFFRPGKVRFSENLSCIFEGRAHSSCWLLRSAGVFLQTTADRGDILFLVDEKFII